MRERFWNVVVRMRCLLGRHQPQSAHEARLMRPLIDHRNPSYHQWRRNGRLECAWCTRDLGPDPRGVGEWG